MLSAEEARLLKTRPVDQVTAILDVFETAIRRAATSGRAPEIDASALVPQPYSMLWMNDEPSEVVTALRAALNDAGYSVKTRAPSAATPGRILISWA